jgi:hypothetical protein
MSAILLNANQIEYEDKPRNLYPHFPGHLHICKQRFSSHCKRASLFTTNLYEL